MTGTASAIPIDEEHPGVTPYRLAVLVTSHNRCQSTLVALTSLFGQEKLDDIEFQVILVDDGSTDGTGNAVRSRFPQVRVLQGDGSLFWSGGMRRAFAAAIKEDFDAYLWFNDDTVLCKDAMVRIVACARGYVAAGSPAIVAGSTRCVRTGAHSYGGFVKRTRGPLFNLEKRLPHATACIPCDTVNGNFTVIPQEIVKVIGNIEARFCHMFGDVDYGLRAKRAGFDVFIGPGYVGECSEDSVAATWKDPQSPLKVRWKSLLSPKGVPFSEWLLFTSRHYGWRFLHYFLSPYAKTIVSGLLPRTKTRSTSTAMNEGVR